VEQRLLGRVAFITGAARGQGRAHAQRLAAEGADIIAIDACAPVDTVPYPMPTVADLQETAALVEATGRKAIYKQVDVRDLDGMQAAADEGWQAFGRLDVVVANAGISSLGYVWELTPEQWHTMIDVTLTGTWHTVKVTVPKLIEQHRGGSIIITSSVAGLRGWPFMGHYVAAKHGLVGLTRTLANELGQHHIRVNSIHPAGVRTGMTDPHLHELLEQDPHLAPIFSNAIPDPRIVEPEVISNMVAFLASDEAQYMTGAQIPVDLGHLTR
jgi:SDR family mycofactocin-dependent oxidoreductase